MRKKLEDDLNFLKADYARIQEDSEKLSFVGGNAASADEQLTKLEKEIAEKRKEIALVIVK